MPKSLRPLLFALPFLFLAACSFSLAADVTPPPGYQEQPALQTTLAAVEEDVFPIVPPDPNSGKSIYAEKCSPCHGDSGLGDGPRSTELNVPVAAIGSPEVARPSTPSGWYQMVTQGNLDRFMPPFPSLTAREKWDVIAYAYTLSSPPEVVAQGEALYEENCARCHGDSGKGNGPEAAGLETAPSDLTDQSVMANASAERLFEAVYSGFSPSMPSFAEQLGSDEIWALTAYLRTLTFATTVQAAYPPPAETVESASTSDSIYPPPEVTNLAYPYPGPDAAATPPPPGLGTVTVELVNGSTGEALSDAAVTLYAFEEMNNTFTATLTAGENGVYAFKDIEMPPERVFLAGVEYAGGLYGSDIVVAEAGINELALQVTVYETTTDTTVLSVDRVHILFDFATPDSAQVVEVFIISNPTDRAVVAEETGGPVVFFPLPEGATNLEFQDGVLGDRYLEMPGGFADTRSVSPGVGQYQVVFAFDIPYANKLEFNQLVEMPLSAVVVMLPDVGIKVKGDAFEDGGVRDFQGTTYQMYNGSALAPGDQISFSLSGRAKSTNPTLTSGSTQNLIIGLGVFGLALVLTGLWLYRRSQAANEEAGEALSIEGSADEAGLLDGEATQEDPDTLMDAIIALDDLYQAGKLPEEAYQQRRAELKEKLKRQI
jgi:mono/diheme cytochrome c family protein